MHQLAMHAVRHYYCQISRFCITISISATRSEIRSKTWELTEHSVAAPLSLLASLAPGLPILVFGSWRWLDFSCYWKASKYGSLLWNAKNVKEGRLEHVPYSIHNIYSFPRQNQFPVHLIVKLCFNAFCLFAGVHRDRGSGNAALQGLRPGPLPPGECLDRQRHAGHCQD